MLSVTWFSNNFREAQNDFPKIIFTYYESLLLVVFSPSVLKNSDQRHMMKIVAFFQLILVRKQQVAVRFSFL